MTTVNYQNFKVSFSRIVCFKVASFIMQSAAHFPTEKDEARASLRMDPSTNKNVTIKVTDDVLVFQTPRRESDPQISPAQQEAKKTSKLEIVKGPASHLSSSWN
jgi:hypothetical protein